MAHLFRVINKINKYIYQRIRLLVFRGVLTTEKYNSTKI